MKKKLVVLTGAGISAESGIKTFRDANGLWENHDIMEVASPQGWAKNPVLVLDFYNQRRAQLHEVFPNEAHKGLVELEIDFEVTIITQNIDDLHERSGSTNIVHLHGELFKARSTKEDSLIYDWRKDINLGDTCELGSQLRPHIVWFGEEVPKIVDAANITSQADIVVIIGTSMQVYPAAGLVGFAPKDIPIFYIDPNPAINYELSHSNALTVIDQKATIGILQLREALSTL